jgi:hypothetical protein
MGDRQPTVMADILPPSGAPHDSPEPPGHPTGR